jgi:hypothetical protein
MVEQKGKINVSGSTPLFLTFRRSQDHFDAFTYLTPRRLQDSKITDCSCTKKAEPFVTLPYDAFSLLPLVEQYNPEKLIFFQG